MEPMPSFRRSSTPPVERTITPLVRAIIAQAKAAIDRGERASDVAATRWPSDPHVAMVLRAAVGPTLTTDAAALLPVRQAFVAALGPMSAGGALLAASLSLTSFGRGQVVAPGFAPGESQFVAEGAPIPVEQFVSAGATLTPYKLATIVALSAELLEHSEAETMMRAALLESVALALDKILFSAAAGVPGLKPPGLLNGLTPLTPAAAGDTAMATDLGALVTAIAPVAGAGFAIVAAPGQAVAIMLEGELENVFASAALPDKTVMAIAPQALAAVLETPRIEASSEAVVHMEDTTPGAVVASAPTRSLWQTNSVGLRLISPVSWALRAPNAVAAMVAVNW